MRKDGSRLLRTVQGKPHATQADHEDALPTPPPSHGTRGSNSNTTFQEDEEDIYRDPESSDDGNFRQAAFVPAASSPEKPGFRTISLRYDGTFPLAEASTNVGFKRSSASASSKRSAASDELSSDSDAIIFSSQISPKRRKQRPAYGANIHGPQKRAKERTYEGKDKLKRQQEKHRRETRKQGSGRKATGMNESPRQEFRRPPDLFKFGEEHGTASFRAAMTPGDAQDGGDAHDSDSLSSALSLPPPSSPGVEIIVRLDLPLSRPYVATTECTICGEEVKSSLKEDFEIEFNQGKTLNYKWQQRFCLYHKQHHAKRTWEEKGYPEVDWDNFDKRLAGKKHANHLRRVVAGEIHSDFREQLEQKLKGRSKTVMQSLNGDGGKKSANVGYYGPRGEKLMTEHIVKHFAEQLRECAARDKLVAAAGVSGGVSGFIHAVLVPELALRLVKEDLGSKSKRSAAEVVAESAELGELLHPEIEDKVVSELEGDDVD